MSNIYTKEELTGCLTTRHWEDEFLCTIWNIKWLKFHGCILHSKIFPTTPHMPKSEFKRRSYVINKLEKKTSPLADFVATKPMTKLCCDKTRFYCNRVSNKLCRDKTKFFCDKASVATKPDFVATELATNSIATNPYFVKTELATNSVTTESATNSVTTNPYFSAIELATKLCHEKNQIFLRQS